YVIPQLPRQQSGDDVAYEGATVIEPTTGYYDKTQPICTLDFSSLYPSIIIAHNLDYTTLIQGDPADYGIKPEDITTTPIGHKFVKSNVRQGLLPEILKDLLSARKAAKKDMAAATDQMRKMVMNARQLALKVSANSVYGFCGSLQGKLPALQISASVTSFGREMIEETQRLVETKYTKANGYEHNASVVYGDTDSVMIKFGCTTVAESIELGEEAADYCTSHFLKPIALCFEKVYCPYLLLMKKRYAGMYWTNAIKPDKMDMKGIETVRRDNSQMVVDVLNGVLRALLEDGDKGLAEQTVKRAIADLLRGNIDMSKLVISKGLTKPPEKYENTQPHVVLVQKMRKRDPLSAPKVGDRVKYIVTKGPKGTNICDRAEDPIYAIDNRRPIDTEYYLEQLRKPLERILKDVMGKRINQMFEGAHTHTVHETFQLPSPTTKKGKKGKKKRGAGLLGFAQQIPTCSKCRAPLAAPVPPLCTNCMDKAPGIYQPMVNRCGWVCV
ncbi:DNA-directed DNA polymerase, family B, partial [Kipferlia bialata]